jgi:hypothetical protein
MDRVSQRCAGEYFAGTPRAINEQLVIDTCVWGCLVSAPELQIRPTWPYIFPRKVGDDALLSFFGDKPLNKITPEDVERYKTSRAADHKTVRGKDKKRIQTKQRLRPATVNRELACLRAMFNHAIEGDVPLKNRLARQRQRRCAKTTNRPAFSLMTSRGSIWQRQLRFCGTWQR